MKISQLFVISCLVTSILSSCTSLTTEKSAQPKYKMTSLDPVNISLFDHTKKPPSKYTVIGTATVSRFNSAGIKRQKAIINDNLRAIAADMGGTAIINVANTPQNVSGIVITYPPSSIS